MATQGEMVLQVEVKFDKPMQDAMEILTKQHELVLKGLISVMERAGFPEMDIAPYRAEIVRVGTTIEEFTARKKVITDRINRMEIPPVKMEERKT